MDTKNACKNCGSILEESHKYCPACGQKVEGKVTLSSLFKNTIANYLSIDSRLLTTLPSFIFQPGKIARQFCEGKRISYLHPGQLYLFFSVLFFFIFSLHSRNWEDRINFEKAKQSLTQIQDSITINIPDTVVLIQEEIPIIIDSDSLKNMNFLKRKIIKLDSLMAADHTNEELTRFFFEEPYLIQDFVFTQFLNMYRAKGKGIIPTIFSQIPLAIFLSLPIYTLLLWLTHVRRKKRFSEHLILTLYLFGFLFMLLSILLITFWITEAYALWSLFFIVSPIYFLISFKMFYRQAWWKAFVKLILVSFAFSIVIIPFAFLLTTTLTIVFYGQ